MEADFSGWATKVGLKCSDGRTIMPGAFAHQDKVQVPLVWQHGHRNPENVLGHAVLETRPEGVYAFGFFNGTPAAAHAKSLLEHKDINKLSIWANELIEKAGRVMHGMIREVSLVLSGANPGAVIENVTIRHNDGDVMELDDEAIITTGLELEHESPEEDDKSGENGSDAVKHADGDDDTVKDVYDSMTPKQQEVLHFMLSQALGADGGELTQDNVDKEGNDTMGTRNVFENGGGEGANAPKTLSHSDIKEIVADAQKTGSLKEAVENFALSHGITDIETLFPEATAMTAAPEFFKRRTEWVAGVLGGTNKTPFSRVKTHWADLNFDEARAKGYIKGNLKKEEFFGTASRVTTPTTIYKKQKLDRDDIIDITDFDVVTWMKGEMRLMLEEEVARAILIGDGREVDDDDKIPEANIRPIATDDDMFVVTVNVNLDDASSSYEELIDALTLSRQYYRGTGLPTMYTTETHLARMLLIKDSLGRRIYNSVQDLATVLRVSGIVAVEVLEAETDIVAILVNMRDYTIGADRGGQTTMFDDFDIDYNQYKYLIETRMSGALTKLKSAMVVRKTAASSVLVVPNPPTFNPATNVVTVVATTGVVYKNGVTGATLTAGAQPALTVGQSLTVVATPAAGYHLASTEDDEWTFSYQA